MGIPLKDYDQVEAWKGSVKMPLGWNTVTITEAIEGKSKNGHDQVEITYTADDGGASVREWIVFAEGSIGKAKAITDAVGIQPQGGDWEFPTAQLKGKKLLVNVQEEPSFKDPTKVYRNVVAHAEVGTHASVENANGSTGSDDEIPF
jgi:hypothetical protein